MNTDQLHELLKTGVIRGVLVPPHLGAALVAGIAGGLQER
jgi:hypothetical protein